ncbi:MAG: ImmA/IrrE family metallo-endopeptidase [Pseudomonadota bacterium]
MSENKIFAGPRIKQIRASMSLSQAAMAEELGISASYLNLIERNQRPITVQLILKLAKTYDISPDTFSEDPQGMIDDLKEVFTDPLMEGELPNYEELLEVVSLAPNVAAGILKIHAGYRASLTRLTELSETLNDGSSSQTLDFHNPNEQVIRAMEMRPNYFDALDRAAEGFYKRLNNQSGLWAGLQQWLLDNHNIRTQLVPEETMPDWNRRFDRHNLRIYIAERLSHEDRLITLATQIAQMGLQKEIDEAIKRLGLKSKEAITLARPKIAEYAAHAIAMPYRRFFQTALRTKYDVTQMAQRFRVSLDHVAYRLTSLVRSGEEGLPFSYLRVDNVSGAWMALSQDKFPHRDFGGRHASQGIDRASIDTAIHPGLVLRGENRRYFTLSWHVERRIGLYYRKQREHDSMLILPVEKLTNTIYAGRQGRDPRSFGYNCALGSIEELELVEQNRVHLPSSEDPLSDDNFQLQLSEDQK